MVQKLVDDDIEKVLYETKSRIQTLEERSESIIKIVQEKQEQIELLRKEKSFAQRQSNFYQARTEFVHSLGKAIALGVVLAFIIYSPFMLLRSRLSDGFKATGLTLLLSVVWGLFKVWPLWKSPEESFHRELEKEKRDRKLSEDYILRHY